MGVTLNFANVVKKIKLFLIEQFLATEVKVTKSNIRFIFDCSH